MSQLEIQADVTQEMQVAPLAGLELAPFPAQNEDPFQNLGLTKIPERTPDQARLALNFRAGKITPEQAQEAYALTRKTNLPQSAVLNDTARVKEMLEEHDLEAFGNDAPLAASWMAGDVIRTNIARDDTLSLKGLEGALQKRPGVMELSGQAYEANTQYLDDLNLWGRHMRGERSPELDSAMKEADQRMKAYAQSVPKQLGLGEEFVVNTAEQLPIQLSILKERGKGYLVGPSVGAMVGSVIPGAGTLAGAGAGLFAGPAAYSASEAYKLESVSAYREFRQDGIPDEAAAIASRAYGIAASVVEFADSIIDTSIIFGGALNPASKAAAKMSIKSAMLGFMKNVGIGKATESAEEAIQQGLQVGIGELAKLATDTESDTTWQGALEEMGTAAWKTLWSAWGAESAVPRFALDVNAARKGGGASYIRDTSLATGQKNEQELLANIDNLSANSKLAQRDPQLYEEAVRSMNQDGAVKNVYMPSSGFAAAFGGIESITTPGSEQATRMNAVLDTLGVTSEIFAESLSSGADIVVPIEKYAAAVAQDQEFATLIANDRRLTEDGFTVRELDQWTRDNESALTSYIKEAQETQQATSQLDHEIEEIHWAAQQQLEAAGVPRDQAAANATQVSAFFGTLAQRAGMTPLQLWGIYAPDVQVEGGRLVEAGEVLPVGNSVDIAQGEVNQAAMIRAGDASVADFAHRISNTEESKKTYFEIYPGTGFFQGVSVRYPADSIRHKDRRHPDMTSADMNRLPSVLASITRETIAMPKKDTPRFSGKGLLAWAMIDGQAYGLVLESVRADRAIVSTFFKDAERNVREWFEGNRDTEKAVVTPAALWPAQAPHIIGNAFHDQPLSDANISVGGDKVNSGSRYLDQSVFHGSPHRFDKFTLDAIGTGEGAQAYGWGLYFAGNKKVSEWYREHLTDRHAVELNGEEFVYIEGKWIGIKSGTILDDRSDPRVLAVWHASLGDIGKEVLKANAKNYPRGVAKEAIRLLNSGYVKQKKETGQLYEVDIPDDDVMLHLDKSLSEQPAPIHEALNRLIGLLPSDAIDDLGGDVSTLLAPDSMGSDLYETLRSVVGGSRQASEMLNSIGIKGNKYQDADSRTTGEGSYNYVIFDDNAINVLQTYYQTKEGNALPRGRIAFTTPSGRPLITLFQQADASTFLHESGHNYLEILRAIGTAQNAVPEIVALWQQARDTLNKTAGAEAATDAQISTAAHELWASSLENYFMKGQAPSMELRAVFARFGAWLKALYNQWRSFGVQPSEELNEIFTRMFATDEQIAEVNAWHESSGKLAKMLSDSEDGKPVRLAQNQATAKQEAESKRLATLTAAYLQALGGRKKIRETAKSTVNAIPVYAAMGEALAGTGIDIETVVDLMGEDAARSIGKKRVGLLRKEGGQDPSILAAKHGYENTYAMLTDMLKSEKKSSLVDRMAKEEEQSLRDKIAQGIAEDEAMPADAEYHSDAQLAVLLSQRQLLANRERMEGMREKQHDAQLEAKALRDAARATIATMPVRQAMQANRHSLAERRAARNAWEAAKVGRWEHAAEYKRQEALSHAMYMASTEARADVNKMLGKVKKAAGTKKLSSEVRDIIDNLAYRFGIFSYGAGSVQEQYDAWMQDAERDTREPKGLAKWAETVTGYGYGIDIPEWILQEGPATDYNDLSFNDFTDVAYTVLQAQKIDRQENTIAINGKRVEIAEAVLALEAVASANSKEKVRSQYRKQRVKETLGSLHAMHAKMEAILLNLDGWKHGIWWNTFFTPIADAENARSEMLKGVSEKIKEISAGIFPGKKAKYDFFNKRIFIESLGDSLTMNQIVSVALNMGNATNKERLLTGEGWNAAQLDAVLEHMDKPHWDFVQNVWDYLETFKSDSFALQREMTGKTPKSVEAVPVMTPSGEYRGGYYPIKYDAGRGNNAFAREQADLDKQLFGGRNYGAAMTRHGHLKERAKGGTGEPLNLDIAVISEHLFNTTQDLTHRRAVVEVAKLVRNKGIMNLIEKYAGKEVAREFKPWIQDIANEGRAQEQMIPLHRMARWARRGTTMMMMGLKVTTIVQQPLGILQTFEVLGSRATMSGLYKIYGNPAKTAENMSLVMQKSVFMRNRMQGYDREVRDAIKGLSMTDSLTHAAERFAYMGIGYMQMGVDMPTWTGAYNKALSENKGDEQAAIDYADSIVRISQGSGMTKDLARVQRGGELMRLFTMFYSYFNALYNLAWRRGALTKSFKDIPAVASSAMLLWFMPAVLSELVSGRGPDEGDDEEWAPWMAQKIAMYPMNMIVGFRDVVGAVGSGFGYQMSAAESAPKALVNWARSIYKAFDEEDPSKIVKPTIEGLGFLFILPLKQPMTTAGNIYDYTTGETPDFQLRDLFFTKQKSRR